MLKSYFSNEWSNDTTYKYSGDYLIDKINDLNPNRVLDVGCGFNHYKDKINNLFGIDPYNDEACSKIGIEDIGSNIMYDVILALGSINFGTENNINKQMRKIDEILKDKGHLFMRLNPGLNHHWSNGKSDDIIFFPWTKQKIKNFALSYGYSIEDWQEEYNMHGDLRYYVHMIKL